MLNAQDQVDITLIRYRICQIELTGSCMQYPPTCSLIPVMCAASGIMLRKGWEREITSRTRWTIRPYSLALSHLGSRCDWSRCVAIYRFDDPKSWSGTPGDPSLNYFFKPS